MAINDLLKDLRNNSNEEDPLRNVKQDIETLREYNGIYGNEEITEKSYDPLVNERNEIKKKYSENYCPSLDLQNFDKKIKVEYLFLRLKIDNLLKIKETGYIL